MIFLIPYRKIEWTDKHQELLKCRIQTQKYVNNKDAGKSRDSFDRLSQIYEDQFALHSIETKIFQLLEDFDTAIISAQKALKINPNSLTAHNLLASSYMLKGDRARAVETVNKSAKLTELQLNLLHWGEVYLENGDGKKAAFSYETALKSDQELKEAKEGKLAADILQGKHKLVEDSLDVSPL